MRRAFALLCGLAALLAAAASSARAAAPRLRDGDGLTVLSEKQLDSRLLAVTVKTAALPGPANVRILLPAGYAGAPHRRYPVFYLLHGTSGGAADWTTVGDAEKTTAGLPVIVVMPDIALGDDGGGWCTNWWNAGAHGLPEWETFHIDQLIPWLDRNLRTIAARRGRAIAGLSQGGFCSMSYAARHPDLFVTALAYSGAPDIAYDHDAQVGSTVIINATEVGLDHVPANSMFGDRTANEINWAAHDPATLAENLRPLRLYQYFGNGQPGPLDHGGPNLGAMAIEGAVWRDNIDFHNRLDALGIPSYYDDYGPGTHSWPYWARDLRQSIGPIMAGFAHPPAPPKAVTYTSADAVYAAFGWSVTVHRAVREFSVLEQASRAGFTLTGSGSATVMTPASYRHGTRYVITVRTGSSTTRSTGRADSAGRLTLAVPLGPSNTVQEYSVAGSTAGTTVFTTRVSIVPLVATVTR